MIYSKYKNNKKIHLPDLKELIAENSSYILMFSLFNCGLILSTVISFTSNVNTSFKMSHFISKYLFSPENYVLSATILFIISFLIVLISVTFSLSCVGAPVLCVLPLISGLIYGTIAGYLINMYGKNGMLFYLISLCPTYTILNTIYLNMFSRSQKLSYVVRRAVFGNNYENKISGHMKEYFIYTVISLIITVFAIIIQLFLMNASDNLLSG